MLPSAAVVAAVLVAVVGDVVAVAVVGDVVAVAAVAVVDQLQMQVQRCETDWKTHMVLQFL